MLDCTTLSPIPVLFCVLWDKIPVFRHNNGHGCAYGLLFTLFLLSSYGRNFCLLSHFAINPNFMVPLIRAIPYSAFTSRGSSELHRGCACQLTSLLGFECILEAIKCNFCFAKELDLLVIVFLTPIEAARKAFAGLRRASRGQGAVPLSGDSCICRGFQNKTHACTPLALKERVKSPLGAGHNFISGWL